ncbi:hypothetical protein ABB27_03820 [Stenotrophomonas terrae]|uniref:Uncharacterized protein n=1 Tax=Stenotrophomonas terrae TaxID=405446 RepID=A0A0R0CP31_9GAMM|nr:hypothetical protein ABB27_03820 [Stenotrophomonas terrae]
MINEVLQENVLKRMERFAMLPHHGRQPIATEDQTCHQLWPASKNVTMMLSKLFLQPLLVETFYRVRQSSKMDPLSVVPGPF